MSITRASEQGGSKRSEPVGERSPVEFRDLTYFIAATRAATFTAAAASLGLTPAGLTKRMQRLEDLLGVALFIRSSRLKTTGLTTAGEVLRDKALQLLHDRDEAMALVRRADRPGGG
jgi:DNA-binding transcriptional LysR family regulator